MKIREHVSVEPQPTVVRLGQLKEENSGWIRESFFLTEEIQKHLAVLGKLLGQENGCGVFLIGHYGSGKSHFLAYSNQLALRGELGGKQPQAFPISLLNFKAAQSLESILEQETGLENPQADRRTNWQMLQDRFPQGIFLLLDELSEFLRSKPTSQSFNEDVRFLQFLGEWAQDHQFWILAALQEQIEHTGAIEQDLYRKIKDRYPYRLWLTTSHVKDLIAGKILRKKPSYAAAVEKLAREMKKIFPDADYTSLCQIYPLHPATLDLLEEVRDRFSQARGIIDFALTRLLGNAARNVTPFLDQPWGNLISPDLIVDHFADLFELQPEFLPIAQKILPYYRKHISRLFEKKLQQELAWRLLKLLILVHLSPSRDRLDCLDAARWLLFKISSLDASKNVEIVKKTLDLMVQQGAYVKRQDSRYWLDLADHSREDLEELLARTRQELSSRPEGLWEMLIPLLDEADFNPFSLPRERWQMRMIPWHFSDRPLQFYLGGGTPPPIRGLLLQIGLPWGLAPQGRDCYILIPKPLEISQEIDELAALVYLRERSLPAPLLKRVEERLRERLVWFFRLVKNCYLEAVLSDPRGIILPVPLERRHHTFAAFLQSYGEWILRQTFPAFERFAPTSGPLPHEAFRQLMKNESLLSAADAPDFIKLIREAYLVPMGLMQRRGSEYLLPPRLENHELVRLLTPLLEHHPSPSRVYDHLAAPPYGLVPEQIHLLLLVLLMQGELDILKGTHSYRETFETLPVALSYDRIIPGRALTAEQLRDLQILCEGLSLRLPRQWTVLAQKHIVEQLRQFGSTQREQLGQFLKKLEEHSGAEALAGRVEDQITQWLALEKGEHEFNGFQHFLYAIQTPARFLANHREIANLPARFERLFREVQRFRHLLSHPCWGQLPVPEMIIQRENLSAIPSLTEPEAVETWLEQAQIFYHQYQQWYRQQHDQWWARMSTHEIWKYQVPSAARCRLIGRDLAGTEMDALRNKAQSERCTGLTSLEFHPLCRCGFDGTGSSMAATLQAFDLARVALEQKLTLFYQQNKVKERIQQWVDQKLEVNEATLAYLNGKAEWPEIENLSLFEQHLSGIELVHPVAAEEFWERLANHPWDRESLIHEIGQLFHRHGPRVNFLRDSAPSSRELLRWCGEMMLKHGTPLPAGLSRNDLREIGRGLKPEWVGEKALLEMERLGLDDGGVDQILGMMLDGRVLPPAQLPAQGPVRAAADLLLKKTPLTLAALATQAANLYKQHDRFMNLCPQPWLEYLNQIAQAKLVEQAEELGSLLHSHQDLQWLVVDCLGLPILETVHQELQKFLPAWQFSHLTFARVSSRTTTGQFYLDLLERVSGKVLEKIDALDALLHSHQGSFQDFMKRAMVELELTCRQTAKKLDPARGIVVFGDHGFRLAPEGRGFTHGGRSTLERIVPVFLLKPW